MKKTIYGLDPDARDETLTELLARSGMMDPANGGTLPEKLRFLTPGELRELADQGVEVGCHGATHSHLPGLNERRLAREVAGAKTRLEEILGGEVNLFSYPDGVHDQATMDQVAEAGYAGAFSVVTAPAHAQRFAIPRMVFGRCRKIMGL